MNDREFAAMNEVEESHFWFSHKRFLIGRIISRYFPENSNPVILDSGCGTGRDLKEYPNSTGMDINLTGLFFAKEKNILLINGNVNAIPVKNNIFDIILSMDVVQHKGVEEAESVRQYARVLKKNGILIINLPAFGILYSMHDRSVDNAKRFSRMEIKRLLSNNFRVEEMFFWNGVFILPASAVRILTSELAHFTGKSEVAKVNKLLNRINSFILRLESELSLRSVLPMGFSLLTVARKISDTK